MMWMLRLVPLLSLCAAGTALADPTHQGQAIWNNQCQSCHVVAREKLSTELAADGRKVLFAQIRDKTDAQLAKYLTDQTVGHDVCEYKALDVYDARLLIAYMRAFSRPEPKEIVPIARHNPGSDTNLTPEEDRKPTRRRRGEVRR